MRYMFIFPFIECAQTGGSVSYMVVDFVSDSRVGCCPQCCVCVCVSVFYALYFSWQSDLNCTTLSSSGHYEQLLRTHYFKSVLKQFPHDHYGLLVAIIIRLALYRLRFVNKVSENSEKYSV